MVVVVVVDEVADAVAVVLVVVLDIVDVGTVLVGVVELASGNSDELLLCVVAPSVILVFVKIVICEPVVVVVAVVVFVVAVIVWLFSAKKKVTVGMITMDRPAKI